MSARKGMNLKRAKYQLKELEEAFKRDATARHKNISVRNALIIAQACVDKQIAKKPIFYAHNYYCSVCNSLVGNNEFEWKRFKYCDNCGQKFDYGE